MTSQGPYITKVGVRGISTTDGGVQKFPVSVMPDEVLEGINIAQSAAEVASNATTTAETAQNTANTAKSTAETARTTANTAKTTAETAKSTANMAKTTAEAAQSTANTAKTTAETAQSTANTAKTTAETAQSTASNLKITMSGCPTMTGLLLKSQQSDSQDSRDRTFLELSTKNSYASIRLEESSADGHVLSITRDGGVQDAATAYNPATLKLANAGGVKGVIIEGLDALIVNSSTTNSTKRFKITVDDTGTITATEVTT